MAIEPIGQIALRLQCRAEFGEIETSEFRIDQLGLDSGGNEGWKIGSVALAHLGLGRPFDKVRDEGQRFAA